MRKKDLYLASFVGTLLLVLLLGLATVGVRASPDTLYVATTGSDDGNNCRSQSSPCPSIGHALNQASSGDTIKVAQGTHTENIYINKNVTLEGGYESTNWTRDIETYETVIDGNQSGTVVTYQAGSDGAVLDGVTITGGDTNSDGGGVLVFRTTATISNNLIEGNNAGDGGGGGIAIVESTATITSNEILSNTATYGGGGISVGDQSTATITNNQILSNTSTYAGGGIEIVFTSNATITGNTISVNTATGSGGGIVLWFTSNATISDNTIAGNSASEWGGGIAIHEGSEATMSQNTISGNSAKYGGGLSILGGSTATLPNDLVVRNVATEDCGAITLYESSASLMNTTVADNSAAVAPGGVCVEWPTQTVAFTNSILVLNGGDDLYCPSGWCSVTYSDLQEGIWPGDGNISVDPLFADAASGNYHLSANSPVIDKGTNIGAPSTDFEGQSRPFDGDSDGIATVDMGADEYAWWYIYLPLTMKEY